MNSAIVAGTPWQLMGSVTLVQRVPGLSSQNTDLYLRMAFPGSWEVAGRLAELGPFRRVFTIATPSADSLDVRGSVRSEVPSPEDASVAIAAQIEVGDKSFGMPQHCPESTDSPRCWLLGRYERVLCTYPYDTAVNLLACSPKAVLELFDDGLGSYVGDILGSFSLALAPRLTAMYLCAPELSHNDLQVEAQKLPISLGDGELVGELSQIFSVDSRELSIYRDRHIVYLTQPTDGMARREVLDQQVADILLDHADDVVVRPHPRDARPHHAGLTYETSSIPWELACMFGIVSDESTLIAECSTAQLTPRLLVGVQPRLVFLNEVLASETPSDLLSKERELVGIISSMYSTPGRTYTPHDFEELARILESH